MEFGEQIKKIDDGLAAILDGQTKIQGRIQNLEDHQDDTQKRFSAVDEALQRAEVWRNQIEEQLVHPAGTEDRQILNVLSPEQRAWLPFVSMQADIPIHGFSGYPKKFEKEERKARLDATRNALRYLGRSNPVLYLGVGAFFQARIKAALAAKRADPAKADEWSKRADAIAEVLGGVHPMAKAALQEDTASEGGYMVPTVTEAVIGWLMKEASVLRRAGATVFPMVTKTHQLPSLANDFSVSWTAEEGTITDAAPATPFSQGSLVAKKQTGLVTVSIELVQDNIVGLMDFVLAHLIQQIGRAEDAQGLEGDGTVFTGLFSASGTNSVAGGSNALSFDELVKVVYGGEHQSTMDDGVIFCHPWIVRDAIQLITGTAGTPWLPFSVQNEGRPKFLLGVPTFPTTSISRTRGGGTETTVYHGNPQYIVIGDRMGTQFDVNPYSETEFKKGQILLRLLRRVGICIWVPGYYTKLTAVTVAA